MGTQSRPWSRLSGRSRSLDVDPEPHAPAESSERRDTGTCGRGGRGDERTRGSRGTSGRAGETAAATTLSGTGAVKQRGAKRSGNCRSCTLCRPLLGAVPRPSEHGKAEDGHRHGDLVLCRRHSPPLQGRQRVPEAGTGCSGGPRPGDRAPGSGAKLARSLSAVPWGGERGRLLSASTSGRLLGRGSRAGGRGPAGPSRGARA